MSGFSFMASAMLMRALPELPSLGVRHSYVVVKILVPGSHMQRLAVFLHGLFPLSLLAQRDAELVEQLDVIAGQVLALGIQRLAQKHDRLLGVPVAVGGGNAFRHIADQGHGILDYLGDSGIEQLFGPRPCLPFSAAVRPCSACARN